MPHIEFIIIPIIFVAAFTRSAFGFGDALIAMPLLSIFIPIEIATPLMGLAGLVITISILIKEWRNVQIKSVLTLIISSLIGISIGIFFIKGNYNELLKIILGSIIVLFSLFNLTKPDLLVLKNEKLAPIFGFIAGILGGAFNTSGPPIVIYSVLRRWKPEYIRATLQGYFLPIGMFVTTDMA